MFKWEKKSQIWAPSLENKWAQEYGQNPNVLVLPDRLRIYFSSRKKMKEDNKYISYIFYVDVDKHDPSTVIAFEDKPVLNETGKGEDNHFDEFGTMPGSLLWHGNNQEVWMYYVGWTRSATQPYKWANGLAISTDGGKSFVKKANGPILSKPYDYPYLQACPRVLKLHDDKWVMWYASGTEWLDEGGRLNPIYVLMNAESSDGLNWALGNQQTIPSVCNKECQSSASVIELNGTYHMFFSYRDVLPDQHGHKQYRVGYASSSDLIHWHRNDANAGIDVSSSGWDAEAVCYPHVVKVDDKIYMFYSGNQFGSAGFGYAQLIG